MPISHGARAPQRDPERGKALGAAYILFIACLTFPITVYRALHPNGWTPGDWLVNYQGGFVRRGLPGEAILDVAHGLHLSPVLLGSLVPLIFYILLYLTVWQLYRRSSGNLWTFAALVSPATLAFPILDPTGAFRKELILLLALAVLLLWLARGPVRDLPLIVYLTVVGAVAILSHEGLLPYLIYLLGALLVGLRDLRRVAKIAIVPLLVTGVTLVAVFHHRGNLQDELTICRSLGAAPPQVCSGSIAYLANGTDVARSDVLRNMHAYHYLFYYPLLTLLALLPLGALAYRLSRDRRMLPDLRVIAATAVLAFLASLPLFVYAMDWGRWIYIHIMSVFLLLLFTDVRECAIAPVGIAMRMRETAYPRWALVALLLYATCWNIPHYGNYPKKGYLNVPLHLLKQEIAHRHGLAASSDAAMMLCAPLLF